MVNSVSCYFVLYRYITMRRQLNVKFVLARYYYYYYYYYFIIRHVCLCHRPFLPSTSLEPAVIPTAHASSFTLQYFPYCVCCSEYSCLL